MRNNPPKTNVHHWEWPTAPWQRIHIDYLGPVNGKMLLIVVDAHSKWPEVFVVPNTTSEHTIICLSSLFARYGYPISLVSDNGPQFTSEEFKSFLSNHGVKHMLSAPYHPATNGQAERHVQIIKRGIKALATESGTLQMKVNRFLLQYRKMPHITTGESPATLFLKRNIRTKIDLIVPIMKSVMQDRQNAGKFQSRVREFEENEKVAVRNYTSEAKWKVGRILAREGKLHYRIQVGLNIWKRHVDQITSIGPEVPLSENASDLQISQVSDTDPQPTDVQVGVSSPQPANSQIQSNTFGSKEADSYSPSTSDNPAVSEFSVPTVTAPDSKNENVQCATESVKTDFAVSSPQVRRSSRIKRAPDRLRY